MVACPLCHRDDQIQRVSAVAAAGTERAWGQASSGLVRVRSSSVGQSGLAMALAWHRPRNPTGLLKAGAIVLAIGVALEVCVGGTTALTHTANTLPAGKLTLAYAIGAVWLVLGLVFLVLGIRARLAFRREAPLRERAEQVWNALYYCNRDDVVFDPIAGTHVPPPATRTYALDVARHQLAGN